MRLGAGASETSMRFGRAVAGWFLLVVMESIHGTIRQLFVAPRIGDLEARQWGVLIGSGIVFAVAYVTVDWIGARTRRQQLGLGALWVAMIVVFEVALGRSLGYSWDRIVEDYDLTRGGFMGFGLLFLLLSPALAAGLRARREAA